MKPKVYTQIYIQLIFAVKFRDALLLKEFRNEVFKYMGGILKNTKHKPLIINGYADHVHVFYGGNPNISFSDTVHDLKRNSSLFINQKGWYSNKYNWQEGYAAFTYSRSQIDSVYKYINNQEKHHNKRTFREEYIDYLNKWQIEYDERYLFEFFE